MNNIIRKTAIAATVLLFVAISSVAQSYQDVVYLKNGSVIRGLIMEQVPSQSLKLVTPDGSTFFCTFDEVEKRMPNWINMDGLQLRAIEVS